MWRWRFCLSLNMHSWCCAFAIRFWCLCCTTVLPIQSPLCPLGEKPVSERGNFTRIEATATWLWAKGSSPICAGSTYKDESERISYWYPLFEHLLATVSVRLHYLGDQNIKVKTCQDHSQVRSDVTHYHGKSVSFHRGSTIGWSEIISQTSHEKEGLHCCAHDKSLQLQHA